MHPAAALMLMLRPLPAIAGVVVGAAGGGPHPAVLPLGVPGPTCAGPYRAGALALLWPPCFDPQAIRCFSACPGHGAPEHQAPPNKACLVTESMRCTCRHAALVLKECSISAPGDGVVAVAGWQTPGTQSVRSLCTFPEHFVSCYAQGFQLTGLLASLLAGAVGGIPFMGSEDRRTYERYHLRRNAPQRTD